MHAITRNFLTALASLLAWLAIFALLLHTSHTGILFLRLLASSAILATLVGFLWSNWQNVPNRGRVPALAIRLLVALPLTFFWTWAALTLTRKVFVALGYDFYI